MKKSKPITQSDYTSYINQYSMKDSMKITKITLTFIFSTLIGIVLILLGFTLRRDAIMSGAVQAAYILLSSVCLGAWVYSVYGLIRIYRAFNGKG